MADRIKVLVMGGKTEGLHEFSVMRPIYEKFLADAGFDVTTTEDRDMFLADNVMKFHVVIDYTTGGSLTPEQESGLIHSVRGGGVGFVGVHSAADSFHNSRMYERMVGGIFLMHPSIMPFAFKVLDHNHPVMTGVGDFIAPEELYLMDTIGHFQLLMSTWYDGFERTVTWIKPHGFGRVFYTALGHGKDQHEQPMFQKLIINAVNWTSKGKR